MSKAMTYVNAALGSTGFCVIHSRVAYRLMPDSWADAMDASYDLNNKTLPAKLGSVQGCTTYLARFDGIDGPLIKVLARSGDQLAQRIEHVTGFKVRQMMLESEMTGQRDQSDFPVRKKGPDGGDRYRGVVTIEGPRTCSSCDRYTMGGLCRAVADSGIHAPAPNEPRRCLPYLPMYESHDGRTGAQLWPELTAAGDVGAGMVEGLAGAAAVVF